MRLELQLLAGRIAISRLASGDPVPAWVPDAGPLVVLARTPHELSIVCDENAVPAGVRAESGFRALGIRGPLPFEAIGVVAGIAGSLAARAIPLLAISTFDTDYVLVREERVDEALEALRAAGYQVAR
jgi:hypothetical protein